MVTGTPNIAQAVEKAIERASKLGVGLTTLRQQVENRTPEFVASEHDKRERRAFLESLYDEAREGQDAFERIIDGNELQGINFLARGALAARAVMRIVIRSEAGRLLGYGTGFLVGDGVLLTNNHVLPNRDATIASIAEAFYERRPTGEDESPLHFALDGNALFYTSVDLDFTLVGVTPRDKSGTASLSSLGWLPLIGGTGKAIEGEWLTIIQHPRGEQKQICVRENQLLKRDTDVLWYSTDTLAGSSGSAVFNNDWLVVALHHMGVPQTRNGRWQTVDGRDYDPARDSEDKIKWIANEGVRVSRIIETLRSDNRIAGHRLIAPMLKVDVGDIQSRLPVLFRPGVPLPALITAAAAGASRPSASTSLAGSVPQEDQMTKRLVNLTLAIDEEGNVSIAGADTVETALAETSDKPKKPKQVIDAPVEEEKDWRDGYDPGFLGSGHVVHLPVVTNPTVIAPLRKKSVYGFPVPDDAASAAGVLKYRNYSVVMHNQRRVALYSAANIDGGVSFENIERGEDRWLWDDRIERKYQIGNSFYAHNKIDRGHLTRREDLEWGTDPVDATRRANGTCTWTNCSPQHKLFNQDKHPNKAIRLWHGLERYILEQTARVHKFKVQAFTGPIFDTDDPLYREVKIPLEYWKIVVAIDADNKLFATAYVLSQQEVLDVTDLDEAAVEEPFGKFQTYQRTIAEIEEATGLQFTYGTGQSLREADPLARDQARPAWRRRRRASIAGTREAFAPETTGPGALESFGDILLGDL